MVHTSARGRTLFAFVMMIALVAGVSAFAADHEARPLAIAAQDAQEPAEGQIEREESSENELLARHKLTLAFSYTHIPEGQKRKAARKASGSPDWASITFTA